MYLKDNGGFSPLTYESDWKCIKNINYCIFIVEISIIIIIISVLKYNIYLLKISSIQDFMSVTTYHNIFNSTFHNL